VGLPSNNKVVFTNGKGLSSSLLVPHNSRYSQPIRLETVNVMKDKKNRKASEYDYEALANWVRGRACGPCRSKDETSIVYDAGLHKSCQRCERLADWLQGKPIVESTLHEIMLWVESKRQQKSEWGDISKILLFASRHFLSNPEVSETTLPEIEFDESILGTRESENESDAGFDNYFKDDWL